MIELTYDIVSEAIRRSKIDQDKVIQKSKEEHGSKTPRTSHISDERANETI